jgi:hypothetical protein
LCQRDLTALSYGKNTPSTERAMRRTVFLLEAEKLTDWRPLAPRTRKRGSVPIIYGLTPKGVALVTEEGLSTKATKVFKPNSDTLLPHEYEITAFHLHLKAFCETRGWKLYWQQRDLKCTVNPDALFGITDAQQNTWWHFLEIEKTKPGNFRNGQSKLMRNAGIYHSYFNTDLCEREWRNFRKFRVVIVQRNDERRTNLLRALEAKIKHRMFWLTTESKYREDIGSKIFLTPKDYQTESYAFI